MPGLYGFYGRTPLPAEELLTRMGEILRQDPACREAKATASCGGIGTAERPSFPGAGEVLTSADGTRQVCLEGAIVGFLGEDGAPEPLAAARRCFVEKLDLEALSRARGSFAAVVLDSRQEKIELISDHNGSLPMSYGAIDGAVLFASQYKAILATGLWKPKLDALGAAMLLQMGYLAGQTSLLEGIRQIPSAAVVHIRRDGLEVQRYRVNHYAADLGLDRDREVADLSRRLRVATQDCFAVSPRVGVPLSGGMDSRLLLGYAPDPARTPTFTFGKAGCRDLQCAADVAGRVNSPHYKYITDPAYLRDYLRLGAWLTEGELGGTHYHILPYADAWADHADVVLDGLGAGHILAGFYARAVWNQAESDEEVAALTWKSMVKNLPRDIQDRAGAVLVPQESFHAAEAWYKSGIIAASGRRPSDKAMAFLHEHRTRRFAGSGPRLLRWRIDVNLPGYDTLVTEAAARLPKHWLYRDKFYLAMIQRSTPAVARARWQHTMLPMRLPFAAAWLSTAAQRGVEILVAKLGVRTCFPNRELHDLDLWLRGPLREFVTEMLLSPRALGRGIFPADLQREVVQSHFEGRRNFTDLLGNLLTLESFCRDFLDDFAGAAKHFSQPAQALAGSRT